MLRPPSTVRSSGLRPPIHSSQQQKHSIQRSRNQASHQTNSICRSTNKSTNDIPVQSRPSIFPRNQGHTPMPSLARRTSTGATRPSNVQKQSHDEISSYSIKQTCNQLNYDYEYLIEEKRRIGYTGAGIIIPSRTEVDEFLLKNIDVPLGIWIYKYVRLYPGEPLAQNIYERQFVPERLDQSEAVNIVRPTLRTQRQTTRILDLFGDKSNTNECQSISYLPHHSQIKSDPQLPILKHSETQIIKAILDDDEFDRDGAIQTRELKYLDLKRQLMEQLRKLQSIDDSDVFSVKISSYDAVLQRTEKILSYEDFDAGSLEILLMLASIREFLPVELRYSINNSILIKYKIHPMMFQQRKEINKISAVFYEINAALEIIVGKCQFDCNEFITFVKF
ncbi:unnamed protein product [Rotaria magnacalcarata]|uniref:Uncharacterized protein n=1 Tax=Rotaria magnacalcarata TaxID=392030 RepID=A0A8S2QW48_9BILA|nr:unnamed protein product [Rotaria magnacalcarata]